MENIYWIAVGMQDIPEDYDFYRYFTDEELFGIWRTIDYRMYKVNANYPASGKIGPASAVSLLENILDCADSAVAGNGADIDLRFGHDTNLLRLLALMGVTGADAAQEDPEEYWRTWQDFNLTPMAANLQMLFYKNRKGETLVNLLLNEQVAHITELGGDDFYKWSELREYLKSRI